MNRAFPSDMVSTLRNRCFWTRAGQRPAPSQINGTS